MEDNAETKKPSKKKYLFSILFLLVLLALTCYAVFSTYDIKDVIDVAKNANGKYIALGVLMILIYLFFEGVAMKRIFHSMSIKVTSFKNFIYSSIDYYFCAITPSATGGQPMVAYYMKKDGISFSHSSLVLLLNTALFKIVLLLLSIVAFCFEPGLILTHPLVLTLYIIGFLINIGLVILCILVAFKRNWVEKVGIKLISFLSKIKIIKKPEELKKRFLLKMDEYEEGTKLMKNHPADFFLAFLYNLIQRVAFFSISFFVYRALLGSYPEIAGFHYFDLFSIQVLIALCVDSLPLPGGIGISEYLYVILLGGIYKQGGIDILGSAMILTRIMNFYIPLLFTGIVTIINHLFMMRRTFKGVH